jgi:hypothetical protein
MKSLDVEHDNERRQTLAGNGTRIWGAAPPRRREQTLFEGWGPAL